MTKRELLKKWSRAMKWVLLFVAVLQVSLSLRFPAGGSLILALASIPDPAALIVPATSTCGSTAYKITSKINTGGGGTAAAVYSATNAAHSTLAVKESWAGRVYLKWPPATAASVVLNECRVLQHLADAGVDNVVRCVDSCYDLGADQATSLLSPLFPQGQNGNDPDATASVVASMRPGGPQQQRVAQIVARTIVQMLGKANTASRDIQLLVNADTGDALFIDFTETVALTPPGYSKAQLEVVDRFLADALRYIPPESLPAARAAAGAAALESEDHGGMASPIVQRLRVAGLLE